MVWMVFEIVIPKKLAKIDLMFGYVQQRTFLIGREAGNLMEPDPHKLESLKSINENQTTGSIYKTSKILFLKVD